MAKGYTSTDISEKEQIKNHALPVGKVKLQGHIINDKGKPTSQITREYTVERVLGAGGFGITYKVSAYIYVGNVKMRTCFAIKEHFMKGCYRGENKTEVLCAPTMQSEIEQSRMYFITEALRLNRLGLQSPNIVKVNEVFAANNTAYYVMEYLDGGDLAKYVHDNGGRLSEHKALQIFSPIAKSVRLLHDERLLHLDIKPDNIVLNHDEATGQLKPVLVDFGLATHFNRKGNPTSHLVAKGTSDGYSPMEQYSGIDHFAPEVDVYALGATLYYMLSGQHPPKSFDINSEADIRSVLPSDVSVRTCDAVVAAMRKNNGERTPTVDAMLKNLVNAGILPSGHLLSFGRVRLSIIGVEAETDCYISYSARLSNPSLSSDERYMAGNPTETPERYTVYEFFRRGKDSRSANGIKCQLSTVRLAEDLNRFGDEANRLTKQNNVPSTRSIHLAANGTYYFYRKHAAKPPSPTPWRRFWQWLGLGLLAFVCQLASLLILEYHHLGLSEYMFPLGWSIVLFSYLYFLGRRFDTYHLGIKTRILLCLVFQLWMSWIMCEITRFLIFEVLLILAGVVLYSSKSVEQWISNHKGSKGFKWSLIFAVVIAFLIPLLLSTYSTDPSQRQIDRAASIGNTTELFRLATQEHEYKAYGPLVDICFRKEDFKPLVDAALYVNNDAGSVKMTFTDDIASELENLQKRITDSVDSIRNLSYNTRQSTLSHISKLETEAIFLAKAYAIPYKRNKILSSMVNADFKKWVSLGDDTDLSVNTRLVCYENALLLRYDENVYKKRNNLVR